MKSAKLVLVALLLVSVIFVSGCTNQTVNNSSDDTKTEVRKNCRELGGYLCSSDGQCALDYLNSTDSYCCPIECGICPKDINCGDEDKCTEDYCIVENGKARCKYEKIEPCPNNGICEEGEYIGPVTSCDSSASATIRSDNFGSTDCPETCDDGNPNTGDWYDFTAQRCEHKTCEEENEDNNEESENDNNYKFNNYHEYQEYITPALENMIDVENIGGYGGEEARYSGSIYFIMFKHGDWDFVYYWAVEVDAKTAEIIKYEEITTDEGDRSGFSQIWWTPEK